MAKTEDVGPILNGIPTGLPDIDPDETQEWLDSLSGVIDESGRARARYLMLRLLEKSRELQVGVPSLTTTDYVNTIPIEHEPWYPGDETVEKQIRRINRWNAAMLVHRAQRPGIGVGGHISTYASAATLYEVGMNHFWRGKDHPGGGDQIFFQGHASPACMPGPSSKAAWAPSNSTASVRRSRTSSTANRSRCRRIRTRA